MVVEYMVGEEMLGEDSLELVTELKSDAFKLKELELIFKREEMQMRMAEGEREERERERKIEKVNGES